MVEPCLCLARFPACTVQGSVRTLKNISYNEMHPSRSLLGVGDGVVVVVVYDITNKTISTHTRVSLIAHLTTQISRRIGGLTKNMSWFGSCNCSRSIDFLTPSQSVRSRTRSSFSSGFNCATKEPCTYAVYPLSIDCTRQILFEKTREGRQVFQHLKTCSRGSLI